MRLAAAPQLRNRFLLIGQQCGDRVEHCDIDMLPAAGSLARAQSQQSALCREQSGGKVGDCNPNLVSAGIRRS